jgi:hypothetical protein
MRFFIIITRLIAGAPRSSARADANLMPAEHGPEPIDVDCLIAGPTDECGRLLLHEREVAITREYRSSRIFIS